MTIVQHPNGTCGDDWPDQISKPPADDFDEHTPPPRVRPIGDPAPRYVVLPRGEPCLGLYHDWDRKGRIPAGTVLCEFLGTDLGRVKHSGYRVVAFPELGQPPLGPVGALPSLQELEGWRIVSTIVERIHGRKSCVVFARMEGGA